MKKPTAAVVFKDLDTQGGLEMFVEGVPGTSPLNGAARKIYDIAQGFAAIDGFLGDPEGAMDECRIIISDNHGNIGFSFDLGKGVSDDSPCSISQQLVIAIMSEMGNLLGSQQ